jgi:membrane protease YdiL (CAAX protease family)
LLQVTSVAGLLAAADLAVLVTSRPAARAAVPVASAAVLGLGRLYGTTWDELGLAPATWRTGLRYGAASAAGIAGVVALAAALPRTRSAFLDSRYRNKPADALKYALVTVPLQTVVPEEIAFRGVLLALLRRHYGPRRAAIASSVLFGLWHIPSSLDLAKDNEALSSRLGAGLPAEILGVAGAVVATAAADVLFVRLRHRSGSLLAPAGMHWAFNGAGTLASAAAWSRTAP